MSSRRNFLATTSLALTGIALHTRRAHALRRIVHRLPSNIVRSTHTAESLLPDRLAPADLQAIATRAITAAREAGASYADIRVGEQQQLDLQTAAGFDSVVNIESRVAYGIRVMRDGVWAFVHGAQPSADAVAAAARQAVATARGFASVGIKQHRLAAAPVVTGEWATPIQVDPFTIALQDQDALLNAYRSAAMRVHRFYDPQLSLHWWRETRVFASTDGSLVTQHLRRSYPHMEVAGDSGMGFVFSSLQRPHATSGGYETVAIPEIQDEITQVTEESARLASLPRRSIDVGRYPVVFNGAALGTVLGQTLGAALDLDRVLGEEADAAGTSFAAPMENYLGSAIASSLISITAGRALPTVSAVQWDDEGVIPESYPIIQNGTLVDYHTTRQTAPVLQAWYEKRGLPVRSHGCAVAENADHVVLTHTPHLAVAPGTRAATLDTLCREISRGVLIRDATWINTDQQLGSGMCDDYGHLFAIEHGKIVARITGCGIQFRTPALWKNIVALGDASTVREPTVVTYKGQPWARLRNTITAPAALVNNVDVISTQTRV